MEEGRVSMSDAGDDKDFLFSEIIPAYNVEKYIGEAIESIVNQDIGFTQNIQLILVDDGSTDATGTICDSYQERFPENVLVIHTDNQGASAARQAGLAQACGAKLILECLDRGLYPSWDAHDRRSLSLAEKLGYHLDHEYPAYIIDPAAV